jgi:UDP-N-acetylglucosamine acyltransferase
MASTQIHSTAVIAEEAELGEGVEIGPYSIVGPRVKIGNNTYLGGHVIIQGQTEIGERCKIFSGACLGSIAQTRKSEFVNSRLLIGNDNIIREFVTINAGMKDGSKTVIGHRNMLMINAHVAHDCVMGNDIVISNGVALAGHVTVEDHAVIGGLVGVHQFVRIGKLSMVGGLSKVVMDVAPFSINDGHPAKFCGLNAVGLRRLGYRSEQMMQIKIALKMLLGTRVNFTRVIPHIQKRFSDNPDVRYLLSFVEGTQRGVARV